MTAEGLRVWSPWAELIIIDLHHAECSLRVVVASEGETEGDKERDREREREKETVRESEMEQPMEKRGRARQRE